MSRPLTWKEKFDRIWDTPAVTLVGANETGGTTRVILESLTRSDSAFGGAINIVNRRGEPVFGYPSVRSVEEVEGEVGVVWLLVGTAGVLDVLEQLGPLGPRAVIVFAGGFAEAGEHEAQRRLQEWSREYDVPVFGPQSLGFVNVDRGLNCLDLRVQGELRGGDVALISQSGGTLGVLIREALAGGVGIHSAFSLGNEAAVGYQDLVEALLEDDSLRAIALYVENLGSVAGFTSIARSAARRGKPIVMLLAGLSEAGQRMAASHTGALTTPRRLVQGIAEQYGVVLVENADELLGAVDALRSSGYQRWGTGRVGFFTGSGGAAVIMSDALAKTDLEVPPLQRDAAAELLGTDADSAHGNPYDMGAGLLGRPDEFSRRVRTFLEGGPFDIAVHLFDIPDPAFAPHVFWGDESIRLTRELGMHPVLATGVRRDDKSDAAHFDDRVTIAYGVASTLSKLRAIGVWSRGDAGVEEVTTATAEQLPGARTTRVVLGEEMRSLLASVPVLWPRERCVRRADDVAGALEGLAYPVVAKAEAGLAHRAKAGGVITRIPDRDAAIAAVAYLRALFDCDVTLSEFVPHDEEHFVGLSRGPEGQPLVALGRGGGGVEDNDIGLRLLPMSARQRETALRRYLPTVADSTAFGAVLEALEKVMSDGEIDSVDLNPLVLDASGNVWALDAKAHLYS